MITALVLITLGVVTQIVVLAKTGNKLPRFNKMCPSCGHRLPPMERPPAFYDCPECQRLIDMGVDLSINLSDRLPHSEA